MSMDTLLRAEQCQYVSLPVYFGAFSCCAAQCREDLQCGDFDTDPTREMLLGENISDVEASHILESIDVSDIRATMGTTMDLTNERTNLVSQKILIAENGRRRNSQYKSIALRALRYDHIEKSVIARHSPYYYDGSDFSVKTDLESNLIVSVSIFFGYNRELAHHEIRLGRLMKVTDRIELSGCHTLLDLKNAFSCPSEFRFTEDFSGKEPTINDFSKNKYPISMFFIHDTFYIDNPENDEDPSELIRAWSETRKLIGPMFVKRMDETRLDDLTARLGQPYVFIHQCRCEHLIVFNDISLRDEAHKDAVLPRRLVERNFRRAACEVCKQASAKWVLLEQKDLLPTHPSYLCVDCYKDLCFDNQNNKLEHFTAVPYCDRKEVADGGKFLSEHRF